MTDQTYIYHDPKIGLYQLNDNYVLLLLLKPAALSYAVVYQNRLIAWCENCDLKFLSDPGQMHEFLNYDFKNVVVGIQPTGFALVPNALYDASRVAELARLTDVKIRERVFAQPLDHDNYVIFKATDAMVKKAEKFDLQKVVLAGKGWLTAIAGNNPHPNDLHLNFDKKRVEIANFEASKLRFYNSFEFFNPDELAYYVTLVANELELQPHATSLIMSGDIDMGDSNAARLAEFFNSVEENAHTVITLPNHITPHRILPLTSLLLCASLEVY